MALSHSFTLMPIRIPSKTITPTITAACSFEQLKKDIEARQEKPHRGKEHPDPRDEMEEANRILDGMD